MKIQDFTKMKLSRDKISMVTCYDYWSARLLQDSPIDCILVGDTLAMIMHGHSTTLPATSDLMALHVQAVVKGAPNKFIIGDMPFLSYRKSLSNTMAQVEKIMQAGANAIKLEGTYGNEETIAHIVASGVPVMGHIGLTPQSVHQLGGFKVQGAQGSVALDLIKQAKILQDCGCFSIVLECIPAPLAKEITAAVSIATIGIGAGADTDGQVLVLHDLLGLYADFQPKFVKQYLDGKTLFQNAITQYHMEVKHSDFPTSDHAFKGAV